MASLSCFSVGPMRSINTDDSLGIMTSLVQYATILLLGVTTVLVKRISSCCCFYM